MKSKLNYTVLILLMLVFFYGLIKHIFDISGWKFILELIIFAGLLLLAFIGMIMVFNGMRSGYVLSALVSAVTLLNLVVIYFRMEMGTLLFLSLVASITAFVVSVVNIGSRKTVPKEAPEVPKAPVKTYIPGKVVASKTGSTFHVPKCDWAKRIKKKNQVWYDSDEDAKKAGLKAHDCTK